MAVATRARSPRGGFPPFVPPEEIRRCFFEGKPGPRGPSQADGRGERVADLAKRKRISRNTVHRWIRGDPRYPQYLEERRSGAARVGGGA